MSGGELLRFRGGYRFVYADSHSKVLELLSTEECEAIRAEHTGVGVEKWAVEVRSRLESNSHILALELQGNVLRADGVYPITRGLAKRNNVLTYLDMASNQIGNTGAKHFADLLRATKTLTVLNLAENRITDEGVVAMAKALLSNHSLTFLSLASNRVRDDGATALAEVLTGKKQDTLVYLDLANNRITELGLRFIADGVVDNYLIRMINVRRNPVKDPFVTIHLRGVLHRNEKNQQEGMEKLVNLFNSKVTGRWNHSKLMVLGRGRSGKTSTVRSLLNLQFRKQWDSTVGASINQASIDIRGNHNTSWREITDSDVDYAIKMVTPALRKSKKPGATGRKFKDRLKSAFARGAVSEKYWSFSDKQ